ncbi:MAG TPA: double-strand break repair protein AddB [Xanthobacteraceae bacterium]|nr:double-strand break repair protein AddB [Xanthobacteraceae bacterium]
MPQSGPRVCTIPASAPFLPTLIEALLDGRLVPGFAPGRDPLALGAATLYLPTRRAARLAREVFLDVLGTDAAILPRIAAIGDVDEDEIAFAEAAAESFDAAALDLPDALDGAERRLLLAELVLKWAAVLAPDAKGQAPLVVSNPAAALRLADDLARLMDDMTMREVSWDKLDELVPDDFDQYWGHTLGFLKIARERWPNLLAERGAIEPAVRRERLLAAEAARLARTDAPVVAAGSTGSIPATAKLLVTIARLPHGALVLPGLDLDLDEPSWELIGGGENAPPAAGHPQFAMHGLLNQIGVKRDAVISLTAPAPDGREFFVSEALRPAFSTERWQQRLDAPFADQAQRALRNLAVIEAATAEEEALAIAIALREALETEEKTAALVTPDRGLAQRVLAMLRRWNVAVDDSGGDRLDGTAAGVFARLAAEAALGGLQPITLLALLKHPLLRLGAEEDAHAGAVAALEHALLRGPRPKPGSAGLTHALTAFRGELAKLRRGEKSSLHRLDPRADMAETDLEAAADLLRRLGEALAPLESARERAHALADLAGRHRDAVFALSADSRGEIAILSSADGRALAQALDEFVSSRTARGFGLAPADYPDLFRAMAAEQVVRRPDRPGVRVRIFGPLEARLQSVDRLIVGGLVEGVWPPEPRSDGWLSRPMRQQLGLDLPERRIGLSAHDFAQAMGAKEVILSRAAKLAGAPTVASRFLQRLAAVAGNELWREICARGAQYLQWARELDQPAAPPKAAERPQPRPPRAARPSSLSVTEIEHWLRDPYSIYAKHILQLTPLDAVDTPPDARDRGTVIHGAIGDFAMQFRAKLPDNALAELLRLGESYFAALEDFPDARAFWWPRFRRIAGWFIGFETKRRANLSKLEAEISTKLEIPLGDRSFTLRTRADRIEHLADGRYAILDYKTGQTPTAKQVRSGLAPQLTLEGAMLRQGCFAGIPKGASIAEFAYVALRGGEPPGEMKIIAWQDTTPDDEADYALRRLTDVIRKFEDPEQGYRSCERTMFLRRGGGDYDHLARIKEWSLSGGLGDGDSEGAAE